MLASFNGIATVEIFSNLPQSLVKIDDLNICTHTSQTQYFCELQIYSFS